MKKRISSRFLTAVVFLLTVFLICLLGAKSLARGVYYVGRALVAGEPASPAYIELHYNNDFPGKSLWITLNGGVQRLCGVRQIKDLVRLDNGQILPVTEKAEVEEQAGATLDFFRRMEAQGVPTVYVSTLTKADRDGEALPPGITDYANENADRFLAILRRGGMTCLDLRDFEEETGHASRFFRTDVHWTPETGFWAFGEIDRLLAEIDPALAVSPALTDKQNYRFTTFRDFFFGSAGRQLGPLYTGKDDFTLIEPKFDIRLRLTGEGFARAREGSFSETLLFPELLGEKDQFSMSMYSVYCGGEFSWLSAQRLPSPSAPESNGKTLLMLGDSFSQVVTPFLALGCDRVDLIDLRLFEGDLEAYVKQCAPDLILVMYAPHSISDPELFRFA